MSQMSGDTARALARGVAMARMGFGAGALLAPGLVARPWIGRHRDRTATAVLGRALGGRDLALGLGLVLAMRHETRIRGWVEAGGLADAGDLVATLVAFRSLPRSGRWMVVLMTAGAIAAARVASVSVDQPAA